MGSPLVVICIFYNRQHAIDASVRSLLGAAPADSEIVLISDGSTDATLAGLQRFAGDARVRVVDQKNMGFTRTLCSAIPRFCTAETTRYLAIFGAGDECYPRKFAVQLQYLEEHADVVALGCGHDHVSENTGTLLGRHGGYHEADEASLRREPPFIHGSVVYRYDAYLASGGYDPRFKFAQDWELYYRLLPFGKVVQHPDILYKRVMFNDGASVSPRKRFEQIRYKVLAHLRHADPAAYDETIRRIDAEGLEAAIPDDAILAECWRSQRLLILRGEFALAREWCDIMLEIRPDNARQAWLKTALGAGARIPFMPTLFAHASRVAEGSRKRLRRPFRRAAKEGPSIS